MVMAKEVPGGDVHYTECSVNEYKPLHAGLSIEKEQSKKLVRINTGSKNTVIMIDVHGLCGRIYGMRAIEDVYGVSASLGKICLPSNETEMKDFLSGSSDCGTLFFLRFPITLATDRLHPSSQCKDSDMSSPPSSLSSSSTLTAAVRTIRSDLAPILVIRSMIQPLAERVAQLAWRLSRNYRLFDGKT
jgi:hypothetical protein